MTKYMRVMDGIRSNAGGFNYKINEINVAEIWNPLANNPEEMGGFNFTNEESMLRWTIRGNTLYDVEIPLDAKIVKCENKNTPNGVFRSNKIVIKNPRIIDNKLMMELYLKSNMPENTYFQCLTFLSLRNYEDVCIKIIEDKVNKKNVNQAINTFLTFFDLKEEDKNDCYKKVYNLLITIKNNIN